MSKTTKTLIAICAVLLVVLVALGAFFFLGQKDQEVPETAPSTEAVTEATEEVTEEVTEEATEEVTEEVTEEPTEEMTESEEEVAYYRNPLTGEYVDAPFTNRIFAVTNSNVRDALPHIGITECDIYFEMFIATGYVRGLALYSNIENASQIGSVRSLRMNFTDIGLGYDAFVAHAGGSEVVLSDAKSSGVEHKNIDTSTSTQYSFRDMDRKSAGWSWEHCLFVNGPGLKQWAADNNIRVTQPEGTTYGLNFVDEGALEAGDTANTISIDMIYGAGKKNTTMVYDEAIGEYVFNQYGQVMKDGLTGEEESFENVFVLFVSAHPTSIYLVADIEGSGDGYYACDGKIIPIKWIRENNTDPFTFTYEDGTPLYQNVGTSYINLAPLDSVINWE